MDDTYSQIGYDKLYIWKPKGHRGKRRWRISLAQKDTDAMASTHCRSENPVGRPAASHHFRKYTENVAPPFYTKSGSKNAWMNDKIKRAERRKGERINI